MKDKLILFLVLCLPLIAMGQTTQDSLIQFLVKNDVSLRELIINYKKVSFNWTQFLATFAGFIFLAGLTWKFWAKEKLMDYLRKKTQEAVDLLTNLKASKILVLSGENSNDEFLKSFFGEKKFSDVKFLKIKDTLEKPEGFEDAFIFANNEDNTIDKNLVRKYLSKESALFYFGKSGSWDFANDTPEISRVINFANSRAQIYGNLMSSLEFLELVKPKIKNI